MKILKIHRNDGTTEFHNVNGEIAIFDQSSDEVKFLNDCDGSYIKAQEIGAIVHIGNKKIAIAPDETATLYQNNQLIRTIKTK